MANKQEHCVSFKKDCLLIHLKFLRIIANQCATNMDVQYCVCTDEPGEPVN